MPKRLIAELEARIATLEAELGECVTKAAGMIGTDAEMAAGPNHGVVLAALDWLHGQKATLEAELAASRMDAEQGWREAHMMVATANALRDALEGIVPVLEKNDMPQSAHVLRNILARTPAASLAAHDAEVLERAAKVCDVWAGKSADLERDARERWDEATEHEADVMGATAEELADAIRALAAQEVPRA